MMTSYVGFWACDELALAVACWFCHVVGVCVCVFGVVLMFLGFSRVCR